MTHIKNLALKKQADKTPLKMITEETGKDLDQNINLEITAEDSRC